MIGNKIKEMRKLKKLSQSELGKLIGTTGASIMRYEKGQREPNKETVEKLAKALNVSPSELLGWGMYEENINNECEFMRYLKSIGYSYKTETPKILESHIENMIDDNGNVVGQDTVIDDEMCNIILSINGVDTIFTKEEFDELQEKSKENIEGAILLQNHKNKKEPSSAATDNGS